MNIKNHIEEVEKEFDRKFTFELKDGTRAVGAFYPEASDFDDKYDYWQDYKLKQFITNSQLSLVDKIKEEILKNIIPLYKKYEGEPVIEAEHKILDKVCAIIELLSIK